MRRLAGATERLDGPLEPRLLRGTLRDLERVNRMLGGAALSWRAIEPYGRPVGSAPLRVLDVGTGAGDIPRSLIKTAAAHAVPLEILATDVRREIVDVARERSRGLPGLTVATAPEDRIDADDRSFDIVHASLVLHHLEPAPAVALLREMGRVARSAVVVNDLTRAPLWLIGAWLLTRIATRNEYTRHDAPVSVRRAYTSRELAALARRAGLEPVAHHWAVPPYRYAIVFRRAESGHG